MSSHRISGRNHIQCDGPSCHDFVEGASRENLPDLWRRARQDGWTGCADGSGDWEHFCPECSEAFGRIVR